MTAQAPQDGPETGEPGEAAPKPTSGGSRPALELTLAELDILISIVEMTGEQSGCMFGDWLDSNPEEEIPLERIDAKLRTLERVVRAAQSPPRENQHTIATLQLHGRGE